jgi:O-acetyl-ADP-ribose deacetylase (regulator of RNase III)
MDIKDIDRGVFAHGCNCQGKMGAGIAKTVKETWPLAYSFYTKHIELQKSLDRPLKDLLGYAQIVNVTPHRDDLFVANCFTQENYGRVRGVKYASLDAVKHSITEALVFSQTVNLPFYMTKIGCNLGGLNWENEVKPFVETLAKLADEEIFVVVK